MKITALTTCLVARTVPSRSGEAGAVRAVPTDLLRGPGWAPAPETNTPGAAHG